MEIAIEAMRESQVAAWCELRRRLWPELTDDENRAEAAAYRHGIGALKRVVLASDGDKNIGFAELSERNLADGCGDGPVAYLEGWYVDPAYQKRGIGLQLVRAAEQWAMSAGYAFLASDAQIDNAAGQRAHRRGRSLPLSTW